MREEQSQKVRKKNILRLQNASNKKFLNKIAIISTNTQHGEKIVYVSERESMYECVTTEQTAFFSSLHCIQSVSLLQTVNSAFEFLSPNIFSSHKKSVLVNSQSGLLSGNKNLLIYSRKKIILIPSLVAIWHNFPFNLWKGDHRETFMF